MLLQYRGSAAKRNFLLIVLVVCLNFIYIKATCTIGSIRLVGGSTDSEGRVEICRYNYYFRGNIYGTICDDLWDTRDAMVVCRQLGYTSGIAYNNSHFGQGSGVIVMSNVQCTGSESYLTSCPHTIHHNCDHSKDAGVSCEGASQVGAIVGGVVGGIVFLICVCAVIVICACVLHSKSNCSRARARQAAPAVQMRSIPAQTTSTTTGAYKQSQSQSKAENQPPPPSYSDYMEQQKVYSQQTAPMTYPGHAVQGYPQQDYSQTGYPQQVPYPQQQQQEAPVGYPQQEPQGYGGTNPGTHESTGIRDEPPPPY
ncbi:PREDICTED: T-cell differentiation antigen CD6-like [Amphimedon queenslandica]|uniref:SRCR domain-containing protein n=1 Tax=Amphimedon queenslandica TaxID=400682 RepID=A0A1X7T2K6_AMPQE|nr:PREDICTED: T-cell differentiation antigen CD6-like [Amphimedon queenslandica]|eukprot:XP_019861646.1 PREDICTED: T-cell differentiation antigen CD6-like [Amphimedon queenslandica]